tara:strand:+ start:1195 stop:1851 length:657 start_codon:yes stop_codon:yes gene_type:complete
MAGMIKNIFGLDTQDVLKKRAERNRLLAAQRIKQGDIDPTVAILGQQFGDMLGRGLMKKLGYEDPEMSRAELAGQFDKELRDKIDSGELDQTSKDYNLLMADYYGKLKDSQNQLRQLELYRIKENQETAINDKVLGRYVQLKDPVLGLSEKQIIDRLKIAFPNFDYSKLTVLNEGSDTPFNNNNKEKNKNNIISDEEMKKKLDEDGKGFFDSIKNLFN